jgi:pimeloyl-ACP methyl ester carboxylesterase
MQIVSRLFSSQASKAPKQAAVTGATQPTLDFPTFVADSFGAKQKKGMTRRDFLIGAGASAIAGTAGFEAGKLYGRSDEQIKQAADKVVEYVLKGELGRPSGSYSPDLFADTPALIARQLQEIAIADTSLYPELELNGLYLPAKKGYPTVLLFQGASDSLYEPKDEKALNWMKTLGAKGYGFLIYDYPGIGASQGKASMENYKKAAEKAFAYITEAEGLKPEQLILWGYSLGSFSAVHLAKLFPCKALVLTAGVSQLRPLAEKLIKTNNINPKTFGAETITKEVLDRALASFTDNQSLIKEAKVQEALFFTSNKDTFVAPNQTLALYRNLPESLRKEQDKQVKRLSYVGTNGVTYPPDHDGFLKNPEAAAAMVEVFDQAFRPKQS